MKNSGNGLDMKTSGRGPVTAPKLKEPFDLGTLLENNLKHSTINAYFDLPLKRRLQPKTLVLLETRVNRLIEKVENEPDSALARVIGKYPDGGVFDANPLFTAAISHNNFKAVAEHLASTIVKKSFGPYKAESFLSYFVKEAKDDNEVRLPKQTIPMMAEQFGREFEALSESFKARLPDKEDREYMISWAYNHDISGGQSIQTLIEERLKLLAAFQKPGN